VSWTKIFFVPTKGAFEKLGIIVLANPEKFIFSMKN